MIDEKKINQATEKYLEEGYKPYIEKVFQDGAAWAQEEFVKSLWHDASEKPVMSECGMIIVELNDITACKYSLWRSTTTYESLCNNKGYVRRWLYLADLLPEEL